MKQRHGKAATNHSVLGRVGLVVTCMACGSLEPNRSAIDGIDEPEVSVALDGGDLKYLSKSTVMGCKYIPRVSVVIMVDGQQSTMLQASPAVWAEVLHREGIVLPALLTQETLTYLMPLIESASRSPNGSSYPVTPVAIIPTDSADMNTLRRVFVGPYSYNPYQDVIVVWEYKGVRPVVADIWASRSTEGPSAMLVQSEFHDKVLDDDDVVVLSPNEVIECEAPETGLTGCHRIAGRSRLTRVGLCGFATWGDALNAMGNGIDRVTEIILFRDCEGLRQRFGP